MPVALKFRDYLSLPSHEHPWLIKPILPAGGMINLFGEAKARKSFLALQLARDLTNGEGTFLGLPIARSAKVLYVQLDTPRGIWQERMTDLETAGEVFSARTCENLIMADSEQAPYPFDILHPTSFNWLKDQVEAFAPDLVIMDVLRKIFTGPEDKSEVMETVMRASRRAVCLTRPQSQSRVRRRRHWREPRLLSRARRLRHHYAPAEENQKARASAGMARASM